VTGSSAVEQWLSQGQRLLRQGCWEEAERALEQAVEKAPEYGWPHLYLALARADAGRVEEALPEIDRAVELSPCSAVLLVFRGRILCDAGRYDEALEALEQALAKDPHYTMARGYMALALLSKGDIVEARQQWERAPEEPPSALLGRMLLVGAQLARHRPLPAEEPIDLPEAAGRQVRRRVPPAAAAALKRARQAYAKERLADAQQAYLAAVQAEPGLGDAWLELAIVSYEREQYETARRALEGYRVAAGAEETDPHYRSYLAGCAANLGSPETALELLEGADPKQPVTPYARALAMLALGRIPEARYAFVQVATLAPRLARTRIKAVMSDERRTTNDQRPTTNDQRPTT
jgi:tetratricopeptide (TPR) repeat protein